MIKVDSSSSLRVSMLVAGALFTLGCNSQGQARNPTFTAAAAPDPAVVVAPISCRSDHPGKAGDGIQSQFSLLLKSQLGVKPVELDAEQQAAVCGAMGGWSDGTKDWKARATLAAVVHVVAANQNAKTVLVPIAKYGTQCLQDRDVLKDENGKVLASVDRGTETCKETGATLYALLFDTDGALLWKSWGSVRGGGGGVGIGGMIQSSGALPDVEKSVTALLDHVPAKFVDAGGGSAPAVTASAPTAPVAPAAGPVAAAPKGDASSDCSQLAKLMCQRAPAAVHDQLCANYETSYRSIAGSPNGAAVCKAQLAALQPHG